MSRTSAPAGVLEWMMVKTVIRPAEARPSLGLGEFWQHRELLWFLSMRDIQVRYKQTVVGAAWAILQPFGIMVVFALFFGQLARIPSDGVPYPVFSYAGLLPWMMFSAAMSAAANSLVSNSHLLTKVYFPRLILPVAAVLPSAVDFGCAFLVLLLLMFWYGIVPTWSIVFLPVFFLLGLITALGVGLWLAAINVRFRDVHHLIPFLLQLWLYSTPVIYPSSLLGEQWRDLLAINPMAGVVEGFRWTLLGVGGPPGAIVWISGAASIALLLTGVVFFNRMQANLADVV